MRPIRCDDVVVNDFESCCDDEIIGRTKLKGCANGESISHIVHAWSEVMNSIILPWVWVVKIAKGCCWPGREAETSSGSPC